MWNLIHIVFFMFWTCDVWCLIKILICRFISPSMRYKYLVFQSTVMRGLKRCLNYVKERFRVFECSTRLLSILVCFLRLILLELVSTSWVWRGKVLNVVIMWLVLSHHDRTSICILTLRSLFEHTHQLTKSSFTVLVSYPTSY